MAGTIEFRLEETGGRSTGFDYLRLFLSLAVIGFHSVMTSYGPNANLWFQSGFTRPAVNFILPAFFALSGFLVAGSLHRSKTIAEFLTLRAVRLAPALFFEVMLSAFVLGPLLTNFALSHYFSDAKFYSYLLNAVGEIHYQLPGLFLDNPDPDMVNRQLWTIPVELKCYAFLTLIYMIGGVSRKWLFLTIAIVCAIAFPVYDLLKNENVQSLNNVPPKVLIGSFLAGVGIYIFKDRIPFSFGLFVISLVLSYFTLINNYVAYFTCVPIAYATIYIGLLGQEKNILSKLGECSYGIYLYGYVIQQTYAHLFPDYRVWWMNIAFTVPVAIALSIASWIVVEKPVLLRRRSAVAFADRCVDAVRRPLGLSAAR